MISLYNYATNKVDDFETRDEMPDELDDYLPDEWKVSNLYYMYRAQSYTRFQAFEFVMKELL